MNDKREIFVCGRNEFGQLGLGDKNNRNEASKLEFNGIKMIHNQNYFMEWSPNDHKFFPESFKKKVIAFMTILKILSKKDNQKMKHIYLLPKPILCHIIRFIPI